MHSSNYFISSFSSTIQLIVDGSATFKQALLNEPFWHEFIPGFQCIKVDEPKQTWHVIEDSAFDFQEADRTIRSSIENVRSVVLIVEATFEYLRQECNFYTLHGSIIAHGDMAVALIGTVSGIGKTRLAAHASKHGWSWLVDEKFTLKHNQVIGGTRGLLNDRKTRTSAQGTTPTSWTRSYPLAAICQPIITTEASITRFDMTEQKAHWTLYDEMTRDIRQVNGIIHASAPPLQSRDTDAIAQARMKAVASLVHTVPVLYLRGPEQLLLAEITSTLH